MALGPWAGDRVLHTTWRYRSGAAHFAWDVGTPRGTDLYAIGNGTIVDCNDGEPDPAPWRWPGVPSNWIILKFTFPSGVYKGKTGYAYYQHLTKGGVKVRKGERVRKGQLIGVSGSSGNSSGPHLHLVVLKPGYTMSRRTRYNYCYNPNSVVWPLSKAWTGTVYDGKVAKPKPPVYLSKLHYGQRNSKSVKMLKLALHRHFKKSDPRVLDRVSRSGNYDKWVDYYVRKDQRIHGAQYGQSSADPKGKSSVGPKQAKHIGIKKVRK